MATTETRVITAHVPIALAEHVDALVQRLERPRGWIVKQALTEFVALEERRYALTLEALADVDKEHSVNHSDITDWIDSLDTSTPKDFPSCT